MDQSEVVGGGWSTAVIVLSPSGYSVFVSKAMAEWICYPSVTLSTVVGLNYYTQIKTYPDVEIQL